MDLAGSQTGPLEENGLKRSRAGSSWREWSSAGSRRPASKSARVTARNCSTVCTLVLPSASVTTWETSWMVCHSSTSRKIPRAATTSTQISHTPTTNARRMTPLIRRFVCTCTFARSSSSSGSGASPSSSAGTLFARASHFFLFSSIASLRRVSRSQRRIIPCRVNTAMTRHVVA